MGGNYEMHVETFPFLLVQCFYFFSFSYKPVCSQDALGSDSDFQMDSTENSCGFEWHFSSHNGQSRVLFLFPCFFVFANCMVNSFLQKIYFPQDTFSNDNNNFAIQTLLWML